MKSNFSDTPMMRFVRRTFTEQVKGMDINGELKTSLLKTSLLKKNKLVEEFIKNLSGQFENVQTAQTLRNRRPIKASTLRGQVLDFTNLLIIGLERLADQRRESDIAKYAREHKDDHKKDMEKTLAGETSGIYEDMGLEIARDEVISLEPEGVVVK